MITIADKDGRTRSVEPTNGCFIPPWVTICPDLTDEAQVAASMLFSYKSDPRSTNADLMNLTVDRIRYMISVGGNALASPETCRAALRSLESVGIVCDYRLIPLQIADDDHAPLNLSVHEFPVNGYVPPYWTTSDLLAATEDAFPEG